MAKYTPMIEQYLKVKEQAQDAFLFFRLGDFYEMFFDDAILAAKELEITLTGREGGGAERIPMCGVPYHSAEGYIQRLIEKGYKVAICEQMEDASVTKGMVRREIVRVVTPGTIMEGKAVSDKSNNYMVCVTEAGGLLSLAACDLSTGELYVTSVPFSEEWLRDEINIYEPSEIIGDSKLLEIIASQALPGSRNVVHTAWERREDGLVKSQFGEAAWARLEEERRACISLLISYLSETQKRSLGQLTQIDSYEPGQFMVLDPFTRRNLELVETVRERSKKGSLLWLLDQTETSMGARLLRRWIDKPLLSRARIEERLEAVEHLYNQYILREDLRMALKEIYDLERLVGRIAFGSANGRDLNALKLSLRQIPALKELCSQSTSSTLRRLAEETDTCEELYQLIEDAIVDEPPVSVRDGGIIKPGYHERLDELREASTNGKRWIAELEARERAATGIKSLKIGYNKVFGYYIEVTKSNLSSLPEGRYERKQTLANAERFVTPELKEKEGLILEAQEKMVDLEYALFTELRDKLNMQVSRLQKLAERIAEMDVYQSLAAVSAEHRFVKPELSEGYDYIVEGGRHPVVEAVMKDAAFIANGTELRKEGSSILLITGPNMAGKSTYMRQVALLSILAQIGCFVPAERAVIPLVDRIFTRIGAADDLIGGQSTFMVEMADIQVMTEKATPRSLIIIDELGRGTSTSEGMAIAQAVIEYVHDHIGCKALVSTHFHELAHLQESLSGLRNYSMAVQESGDKVHFLRKLIPGAADSSYGIYCARLAGLPGSIIDRAYGLLQGLEQASLAAVASEHGAALQRAESAQGAAAEGYVTAQPRDIVREAVEGAEPFAKAGSESRESRENGRTGEVIQLSIFDDEDVKEPQNAVTGKEQGASEEAGVSASQDPSVRALIEAVKGADLMNMTPLQAMQLLNDLKMKAKDM
ncbi:DNA mismatch repair protein MutS [Paenibacillus ihbetae]|uniref:DNA mismatch repair protein MutS n=1 Tax=Paenibacillus ihbetae TaxID=1870820 RepID=A0A1B2DVJ2_9BACL|nr:DNA mismatch repair protein MutS [Paenibacillus ihbetae]ANY71711.1 DNA mismatch repair protein MutS [Paenibacillus ihbetae]OOC60985.1 DNA mismatch repair protein MutS [Paenibacillus ihbetae]